MRREDLLQPRRIEEHRPVAGLFTVEHQPEERAPRAAVAEQVERGDRPPRPLARVQRGRDAPGGRVVEDVVGREGEAARGGGRPDRRDVLARRYAAAGGRPGDEDPAALGGRVAAERGRGLWPLVADQHAREPAEALAGRTERQELPRQRVELGGRRSDRHMHRAPLLHRRGQQLLVQLPSGRRQEAAHDLADLGEERRVLPGQADRRELGQEVLAPRELRGAEAPSRGADDVGLRGEAEGVRVAGRLGAGELEDDLKRALDGHHAHTLADPWRGSAARTQLLWSPTRSGNIAGCRGSLGCCRRGGDGARSIGEER